MRLSCLEGCISDIKELLDQGFWLADYLGHAVVIAFFCSIIWLLFTFLVMKGSFRQMQGILVRVRDARRKDPEFDLMWKKLIIRNVKGAGQSNVGGILRHLTDQI